jgi:hypothetical protein
MKTAVLGALALSSLALASPAHAQNLAETAAGGPALGARGQVAISSDFDFSFLHSKNNGNDIILRPALDYFIAPQLSLGGEVLFRYRDNHRGDVETDVGLGARVGYNIPLAPMFSLFPRAGFRYTHVSVKNDGSANYLTFALVAPFLFHPVPHFFIGLGPMLEVDLAGGDSRSRDVQIGLATSIGGYFDW